MILKLLAKLGLDKSGFDSGIDSAGKKAQKFGADLKSQLAGGFTLAAFASLAKETIAYGDSLEELAGRLNVTTQQAQEYAIAAKLGGTDTEFFAGKWEKLQHSMRSAQSGGGNPFASFGIGIEELKQMNASQVLEVLAADIEAVGFSAESSVAFMEIFGKGGGKMANVLRDLANAKNGTFLFSDAEIAQLQRADDVLVKIGNNAKVVAAWLFNRATMAKTLATLINPFVGAMIPEEEIKKRDIIPENPGGIDANAIEDRARAADRVAKMQQEADDINEKSRRSKLTEEQRLNEIFEERAEIFRQMNLGLGPEAEALLGLEFAKLNAEEDALKKPSRKLNSVGGIHETAFGRIGAFTGEAARAAAPPEVKASAASLQRIEQALVQKGIIIRDVNR